MLPDHDIDALLAELGFAVPDHVRAARAALEGASLTRPGKRRIAGEKRARVESLLRSRFALACRSPECQAALRAARAGAAILELLDAAGCEHCSGSDNRRSALRFAEACRHRGVRRVVVVGGSPSVHGDLIRLTPPDLELRIVVGTERRTLDRARADVDWAQLVLIWGGSELDHKVSRLYTDHPAARGKLVTVPKRGVAALLAGAAEHLER